MVKNAAERGQLILIGAIALAFILITLVMLFNGVLFTETVSSSETRDATTQAIIIEYELENALEGYVARTVSDPLDPPGSITSDPERLGNLFAASYSQSRPADVSVDFVSIDGDYAVFSYTYESREITLSGEIVLDLQEVL